MIYVTMFHRMQCFLPALATVSLLWLSTASSRVTEGTVTFSPWPPIYNISATKELDIQEETQVQKRQLLANDGEGQNNKRNSMEAEILIRFREAIIGDPSSILNSWNVTADSDICTWSGIACDTSNHVSAINLSDRNLTGNISPFLSNLSSLSSLILAGNSFSGPIPSSLGILKHLRHLDVSRNHLTSRIPPEISNCSSLTDLNFSWNYLEGSIPKQLGSLQKLSVLDMEMNQLSASIPIYLGNCSLLQYLSLSSNKLTGTFPHELSRLRRLSDLRLFNNSLSGSVPSSLSNCTALTFLKLGANNLTGKIPSELGDLKALNYLGLYETGISGSIPASIGNMTSLDMLDLGCHPSDEEMFSGVVSRFCPLSGNLPPELGRLRKLSVVLITATSITGDIPEELGNLPNIARLFITFNQLTGRIPPALGNLTTLSILDLSGNKLEGEIPSSLGNAGNMHWASFRKNQLTGKIPAELGNLTKMDRLLLSHNRLNGPVIRELGKLASMLELGLDYNQFSGELPAALGNCSQLLRLYLSFNNISGSLPVAMAGSMTALFIFSLSHNQLSGSIPEEIGSMKSLNVLDLSFNNLSGPIPSSIENCKALYTMDMSNNYLSGPLPVAALESLLYLQNFTVANNDLEGAIPGRVGAFVNVTAESYAGNAGLCGPILDKSCSSKNACHGIGGACHSVWIYVASAAGAILLAFFIITVLLLICRRAFHKGADTDANHGVRGLFGNKTSEDDVLKISKHANELKLTMEDLWAATGGFSEFNVLGKGGQSTVYKAVLLHGDGTIFAVKRMRVERDALTSTSHGLYHELQILRKIRHRNLIKFYGYCATQNVTALLMEFAPNGSLESHLHPNQSEVQENYHGVHTCQLSLETRIGIAVGVADAMAYLHQECHEPIIHSDLKPSNVLLDYEFNAKIADFGISRYVKKDRQIEEATVSAVYGTTGYIPPEYATSNRVSTKGDVYSYGVVLLELLTGKRPTDQSFARDGTWLSDWVLKAFPNRIADILDNFLKQVFQTDEEQIRLLVRVGLLCTRELATDRPSMQEVQKMLAQISQISKPGTFLVDTTSLIYQD